MRGLAGREGVAWAAAYLHRLGLIAGVDGNISAGAPEGFWITPSGCHKALLTPEDILLLDQDGRLLKGEGRPSSEWRLHQAIYRAQVECGAVVHAHPPWTLALGLSGHSLSPFLLTEAQLFLKDLVRIGRMEPGSRELAAEVGRAAAQAQVIVLEHHGAVTWGRDLAEALARMECLEHCSRITLLAKGLGPGGSPRGRADPLQ